MHVSEYAERALRTENTRNDPHIVRLDHAAMGLITEAGELVDALKRHKIYSKELDFLNLKEEIGDVAWYLAVGADELDIGLVELLRRTIILASPNQGKVLTQVGMLDFYVGRLVDYVSQFNTLLHRCRYGQHVDGYEIALGHHLGSIAHTLQRLSHICGFSLEDALEANIAKLSTRYPDKFSPEAALNRDHEAEKKALETGQQQTISQAVVEAGIDPVLSKVADAVIDSTIAGLNEIGEKLKDASIAHAGSNPAPDAGTAAGPA